MCLAKLLFNNQDDQSPAQFFLLIQNSKKKPHKPIHSLWGKNF